MLLRWQQPLAGPSKSGDLKATQVTDAGTFEEDTTPKIRVILADDHAVLRTALATYLDLSGDITVIAEASDGQQAIDLAREHQPDVVLLDLNMPNVGGLQALPQIKAENPKIKVLV